MPDEVTCHYGASRWPRGPVRPGRRSPISCAVGAKLLTYTGCESVAMATESADGPDVSVTLPAPLEAWLDERADELGVERAEVLVQLVSAYRASSELVGDPVESLLDEGASLDEGDAAGPDRGEVAALEDRLEALEATHGEDVEDVRNRVLQLRDAVRDRADETHDHDEFHELAERIDALASDIEDVGADVTDMSDRVDRRDDRLADVESKLDRLAGAVLAIRDGTHGTGTADESLEHILVTANRSGVQVADCCDCGRTVQIPLLTRPACPHCETEFRDLDDSRSGLGRWLDRGKPRLVGAAPPALESADE